MTRPVEDMSREDLENEVLWLRGELGVAHSTEDLVKLRSIGLTTQLAKLVLTLYGAAPRTLTTAFLDDAIRLNGLGEGDKLVGMRVCIARRHLGRNAIQTVWGQGYRMTPAGVEAVSRLLGRAVAA